MKKLFVFLFFVFLVGVFFYKVLLYGSVPFPGDLLIAEYNPWKTYSYLGYVPGSFPNKAQYFDTLRQLYPWKTLAIELVKHGQLPFWNPYNFSGAPLLANFQSAVFYPLNLLYLLLPQVVAWTVLIIVQPLFACFFTYQFGRKIGLSHIGSVFAAVSYGFSSFMTVWLEYNTIGQVILWLPLALLAAECLLEKLTVGWSTVFLVSLVFSLLAGHPQVFTYLVVFVFCYTIYRFVILGKPKVYILTILFLFSLAPAIGALQLVPGIELIRESARSPHPYSFLIEKILIQPWQLAMLFVPDFFGNPATRNYWPEDTYVGKVTSIGLVPLFFVLLTLIRKRNQCTTFFQVAVAVLLLLVTANPITALFYRIELPVISTSAPTLAVFLFCFSLSMLCGSGIDLWQKEKMPFLKWMRWVLPIIIVFMVLWIAVLVGGPKLSSAIRNMLYGSALVALTVVVLFIGYLKARTKTILLMFLLLIHIAVLWRSFDKFNPFVSKDLVFPKAPIFEMLQELEHANFFRFWGYGAASIGANVQTQYQLFSPDGYDPLYPKRYGEFIHSSKDGKITTQFTKENRSDAVITPGFGQEDLSTNAPRLRVLDLLGVRYVLDRLENASTEKTFPQDRFTLFQQENGWRTFENKKAFPRAFLAFDYRVFKDETDFEALFFASDFDPAKTVLLEESLSQGLEKPQNVGEVSISAYHPNSVSITTKSETQALLFLSDTYYPGWKAFVDSQPTKIYRADYAFRAVVVPKGDHTVRFTYSPQSFLQGATISGISVMAAIIFLLFLPKWRKHI